jgi:hypothetical protein
MKSIFKLTTILFCIIFISSCSKNPIIGTWQYDGGLYNGREQKASTDFLMQRTYAGNTFEAFLIEGTAKPELYSSGIYVIKSDTLLITSKFSSRPSQNTDLTISYNYVIDQNNLTIKGVLPNGMIVEEYWKKVKQ